MICRKTTVETVAGGNEPRSHGHGSHGFGLRTAGPVFIFQADTPVSEGHQVNKVVVMTCLAALAL